MKLCLSREILSGVLGRVIGAIGRNSTLSILECLHLHGDGQQIVITATDLENTLQTVLETPHEPFVAALPGRRLYEMVTALPQQTLVTLREKDSKWVVSGGGSRFTLAGSDPQTFPAQDRLTFDDGVVLEQKILKGLLDVVEHAAAKQDVRSYLNGVYFHLFPGKLALVATDGHRLAEIEQVCEHGYDDKGVILPLRSASLLKKILGVTGEVRLCFSENRVRFDLGETTLITTRIDGRYPDYRRVMSNQQKHVLVLPRSAWIEAIQRAVLVMDKKSGGLELAAAPESLVLRATQGDHAAEEHMTIPYEGEEVRVQLSAAYLLDALHSLTDDQVLFRVTDSVESVTLEAHQTDEGMRVIMPMRL